MHTHIFKNQAVQSGTKWKVNSLPELVPWLIISNSLFLNIFCFAGGYHNTSETYVNTSISCFISFK